MPILLRTSVGALALAALLSACPSDDPVEPGPDASAPEPCSLVTQGEAELAAGDEVAEGQESTVEGVGRLCSFDGDTARVTVMVYDEADTPAELTAEDAPGEIVDDIGDAAYFYSLTGDLQVVVGDVMFHVGVFRDGQPSPEDAEALALLAAGRVNEA